MRIELDCQTTLAVVLIIVLGISLIYLPYLEKRNFVKPYIEHFPSTLRYSDNIRKEPKVLIPKIMSTMQKDTNNNNTKSLADDYMFLYDYEKNFDINKVYGDFSNRLDAYENFLKRNKNDFHNLDGKDVDNLTKLLSGVKLSDTDIPGDFSYEKEFRAMNE